MGASRLWGRLMAKVKHIQHASDAEVLNMSLSSRYLLAPALVALSSLYSTSCSIRGFYYRNLPGVPTGSLPLPVISIGNLVQASGKTPFVEFLVRWKCVADDFFPLFKN
jgi:tetraacyldisaccharide-1-P 4'-kinase